MDTTQLLNVQIANPRGQVPKHYPTLLYCCTSVACSHSCFVVSVLHDSCSLDLVYPPQAHVLKVSFPMQQYSEVKLLGSYWIMRIFTLSKD